MQDTDISSGKNNFNKITEKDINSRFKLNNKASNVRLLSLFQFTKFYILTTCLYC